MTPPATISLPSIDPRAPIALGDVHARLEVGATIDVEATGWPVELLHAVIEGAGFSVEHWSGAATGAQLRLRRERTLADTVGSDMAVLTVGLNPSVYSADLGIGFARPGNRFWPAAIAAGLVHHDRDPRRALAEHNLGMTDLVKRATARADELDRDEYRRGLVRLERLVEWLAPRVICAVGLAGWRAAVDRHAVAGVQPGDLAGVPVYLMPSTSGLNASSSLASLTQQFSEVRSLAG